MNKWCIKKIQLTWTLSLYDYQSGNTSNVKYYFQAGPSGLIDMDFLNPACDQA